MFFIIKTISKKLLVVIITIFFLAGSDSFGSDNPVEIGIVMAAHLNIRIKPEKESKSIAAISKKSLVKIIAHTDNGWLEIKYNNLTGFVRDREKYINIFKEKIKKKTKRILIDKPYSAKNKIEEEIKIHSAEINKIDQQIKEAKTEVYQFSQKEIVILNGLNEIDISLNKSRKKLSRMKKEISLLNAEIKNNNNALMDLKLVIRNNERYIEKRIVSLYKLNQLGQMNVLASSDSIYDFLSRKNGMESILEADEKILKNHLNNLERLSELQNRLSEQKSTKVVLKNTYKTQLSIIEQTREKKQSLLSEIQNKKSLKMAAIESLKEAAKELNQTITALDQGFEDSSNQSYTDSFIARKGLMRVPVKGEIINHFGKNKDKNFLIETFHSGIKIKADRGEPIQAISSGKVIFADWLKGYGNLIIIDHGNHYYSLYGHAEELFKAKDDPVENREVIATVGDSGALDGTGLHFELRHKGEPIAPLTWLQKDLNE